jgi:hypothetical protein
MIVIIKGRQRQYKTTVAIGTVLDLVMSWGFSTSEIVSNVHLFKPTPVNSNIIDSKYPVLWHPENLEPEEFQALNNHCIRNSVVELEQYHYVRNRQMVQFVKAMVTKGLKHRIILIDEIDRVFPHRFWQDQEQTEALLGLWQDEKLFNWIIGTAHLGLGIDKQIRESMQVEVITETGIKGKTVNCIVMNALDVEIFQDTMEQVPLVQRLFYSWEPVK